VVEYSGRNHENFFFKMVDFTPVCLSDKISRLGNCKIAFDYFLLIFGPVKKFLVLQNFLKLS
jgi:hypothetical protein